MAQITYVRETNIKTVGIAALIKKESKFMEGAWIERMQWLERLR